MKWSTKSAGEYPKGWSFAFEEARLGESVEVLEAGNAAQLDWNTALGHFVKVMPKDYKRVLEAARLAEERGEPVLDAIMAASHG